MNSLSRARAVVQVQITQHHSAIVEITTKQEWHIFVLENDRWEEFSPLNIREMCVKKIPKTAVLFWLRPHLLSVKKDGSAWGNSLLYHISDPCNPPLWDKEWRDVSVVQCSVCRIAWCIVVQCSVVQSSVVHFSFKVIEVWSVAMKRME